MKNISNIMLLTLLWLTVATGLKAQKGLPKSDVTLHMLIFTDQEDREIGESVKKDYDHMSKLAQYIKKNLDISVNKYYFPKIRRDKEEMLSTLDNLKGSVKANDVVFFYYSGHGYRTYNSEDKFPRLLVTNKNHLSQNDQGVAVKTVREKLSKLNNRLTIIMADACNSTVNISEPEDGYSGVDNHIKQLKILFLKSYGEIVLAGSQAGDGKKASGKYTGYSYSNINHGGFMTYNFIKALFYELDNYEDTNWNKLLKRAKSYTIEYSKQRLSDKSEGNNVQIPVYEYSKK